MGGCREQVLRLEVTWEHDRTVVTAAGEIDLSTVASLTACLESLRQQGESRVEIDLGAVTFLGAAGLNALLHAQAAAAADGGSVTVSSSSDVVDHLIAITATAGLRQSPALDLDARPPAAPSGFVTEWASPEGVETISI